MGKFSNNFFLVPVFLRKIIITMPTSNAVGSARKSAVVGYLIAKGSFQETSPNLPMRIAVLCEANNANQSAVSTDPIFTPTSAQQVGQKFGYGSPAYMIARILFPLTGGGLNGIPVVFYPQAEAAGATAKVMTLQPVGMATGNATHTIVIGGRTNVDSQTYDIPIVTGDTLVQISAKIANVLSNVIGCPASVTTNSYVSVLTTKWKGATADEMTVSVNTNGNPVGMSYNVATIQNGSGTPINAVTTSLGLYGTDWNTITINSYGTNTSVMTALESFNGRPDNTSPTGRYTGIIMKPTLAFTGSISDDPSNITDARLNDCTIVLSPAPNSAGFSMEAATNHAMLVAKTAQETPELDILNSPYPDMPAPVSLGSMASYDNRDTMVKKGCTTVDLVNGVYIVKDSVTTYHPVGEIPPQFAYTRDLLIDWNIRYNYYLLEQQFVVGKVLARDEDNVTSQNVIKPKQWKQALSSMFADLISRALLVDQAFTENSLTVSLNPTNPNRFDTIFKAKRSGVARISATTAIMGFNFGTLNS